MTYQLRSVDERGLENGCYGRVTFNLTMYKPERLKKRKGVRGCTPSLPSGLPVMIQVGSVQVLPPSHCAQKHNSVSMSTVSVSTGRADVIMHNIH